MRDQQETPAVIVGDDPREEGWERPVDLSRRGRENRCEVRMAVREDVNMGGKGVTLLILQHMNPVSAVMCFGSQMEEFGVGVTLGEPLYSSSLLPEQINLGWKAMIILEELQLQVLEPLGRSIVVTRLDTRETSFKTRERALKML